jgi:hypothetical protein
MPSSTSHRVSFDRWHLAALFGVIVGAPMVWLVLLETNYALAYAACADRSNAWLHVPSAIALVATAAIAAIAVVVWHRARGEERAPLGFLALVSLMSAGLFLVVIFATVIPPFILHPCD